MTVMMVVVMGRIVVGGKGVGGWQRGQHRHHHYQHQQHFVRRDQSWVSRAVPTLICVNEDVHDGHKGRIEQRHGDGQYSHHMRRKWLCRFGYSGYRWGLRLDLDLNGPSQQQRHYSHHHTFHNRNGVRWNG